MLRHTFYIILGLCAALVFYPVMGAASENFPAIEARADRVLRQMGGFLKTARQFTFRAHSSFDRVTESGRKLQYEEIVIASVRRPNRFHVAIKGDLGNQRIWYDGKSITLLDLELNLYAFTEVPADIDGALDFMAKQFGVAAPLSDLVLSDPYTLMVENVKSGSYVGLHQVNGVKSHHLVFTQENIDWQVWVEDGIIPVLRKLVITYEQEKSSPQYTSMLSNWDFNPWLPVQIFEFQPPENAKKVEFSRLVKQPGN